MMKSTALRFAVIVGAASLTLFSAQVGFSAEDEAVVDLTKIDRTILKEPKYEHRPYYALIVFGLQAQHRSWMVMDGKNVMYFDRNGNGDLTDTEDRIEYDVEQTRKIRLGITDVYSTNHFFDIGEVAGVKLTFHFWVRQRNPDPKTELGKRALQLRLANDWENGTLWRHVAKGGKAQTPIILTRYPADAEIAHLDGSLTFEVKWADQQRLQPWPQSSVFDLKIGTPILPPRNYPYSFVSPLTVAEIPRNVHPVAVFTYPSVKPGETAHKETVILSDRCCGDTVLARMELPKNIGPGPVSVTVSYPGWKIRDVKPATFEMTVGNNVIAIVNPDGKRPNE